MGSAVFELGSAVFAFKMRNPSSLLVVAAEASSRNEATAKIGKDAGFGPQESPHPAMHVTASLVLGASEQDETFNGYAVLLDGAPYVCYASHVP